MTSSEPSQPAKLWISSSTIASARARLAAAHRSCGGSTTALQVVDVGERHAGQPAAGRLDVARHGEVDQQQRPPARARA